MSKVKSLPLAKLFIFQHNLLMEARRLELLTSGLQSPRSAKLSYAPITQILVAGAGFEPTTFGL